MNDDDLLILARRFEKELVKMDKKRKEYKRTYKLRKSKYFQVDNVGCSDGSDRIGNLLKVIYDRRPN